MAADKKKKNQKGFAILEAVVFLTAFMVMAVYSIDFFTAIHSGVVGSIGARAYLFETLRHRSDIDFLRTHVDSPSSDEPRFATQENAFERFHAVTDEDFPASATDGMPVVARVLTRNEEEPSEGNLGIKSINDKDNPVTRIYVKSGYGICTDSRCQKDGG